MAEEGASKPYDKPPEVESKFFPEFRAGLPRMDGKVVAITGCTSGTGYICAKACAELGAQVVMLNRASERADAALLSLQEAVPEASISLVPCDLMSFASVRASAKQLKTELGKRGRAVLDVLCCNAGIMMTKDAATEDGCDTQMQTNHLSHFILAAELWPLLENAVALRGEARVVSHSSGARRGPPLEEKYFLKNGGNLGGDETPGSAEGVKDPNDVPRMRRYHMSKLANVAFTYALRDRAAKADSKVKALCAHPGLAATNLQVTTTKDGGMQNDFSHKYMEAAQSAEDGTMGILRCCCAEGVNSGDFFGPKGARGPADLLDPKPEEEHADEASREMLWKASCEVTEASFPF